MSRWALAQIVLILLLHWIAKIDHFIPFAILCVGVIREGKADDEES